MSNFKRRRQLQDEQMQLRNKIAERVEKAQKTKSYQLKEFYLRANKTDQRRLDFIQEQLSNYYRKGT